MNTCDPFIPSSSTIQDQEPTWSDIMALLRPSPPYEISQLSPYYLPPQTSSFNTGNNVGNVSMTMNNFVSNNSFDYHEYPYGISLPEDLYPEVNQIPEFFSYIDNILSDAYEKIDLNKDNYYNGNELGCTGFHSEPLCNAQFPMAYYRCPNQAASAMEFCQPYGRTNLEYNHDRISQIWASSAANLTQLPNDLAKDYVDGKCIDKGSEGTLYEAKNFGLNYENYKNPLMEKDLSVFSQNFVDYFSSGSNALPNYFEQLPDSNYAYAANFARSFSLSTRQKQPLQNASMAAGTEENYSHSTWSHGEPSKIELERVISSLTAYIAHLEFEVKFLTYQVQDMTDQLTGEKRPTAQSLDHCGNSEAVIEESEKLSYLDETARSKLFIGTEDASQKPDVFGRTDASSTSASDWEII